MNRRNGGFFFKQHQKQNNTQPSTNTNSNNSNNQIYDNINIEEAKNSTHQQGKNFQFELKYQKGDFHSQVTIRGIFNDDKKYDVWRRIHHVDKKEKKMSPAWLSKQRDNIVHGILMKAFHVKPQDIPKRKPESLKLCFEKLKMLTAKKKLEVKQLMLFDQDEIKIIETKMISKIKTMDLVRELFDYFASSDRYLENEHFMDILDDCIVHHQYESAVFDIYNGLHKIMMKTKSAKRFDFEFILYQKKRLQCEEFKTLLMIFEQLSKNPSRTYQVNHRWLSNVYVYAMLDIYLKNLTCIVYELIENDLNHILIDNSVSNEQAASFGGSSYCSLQRISYSRHLTTELRKIRIFLQKYMLCQENERKKVPSELHYQNMGGMYFITPLVYPLCIRVLSDLAVVLNRTLVLPSVSIPNFTELIKTFINNKENIEDFKKLFPSPILEKYNEHISVIYERWMTFMCRKYIWSKFKQADFGEVGLGLRDQFNFGHMEYMRKHKAKKK
eukprot:325830_1